MKVLIVDDALFARTALKKMLDASEDYDFTYLEASSGEESVEVYTAEHPDLVIMDITMPGINGIEAVKRICEIDEKAKVIMCSSTGYPARIVESINMGASDFIVKPFKQEKLLAVIKRVLG